MIDLENDVFTYLSSELRTQYPGIYCVGEYVAAPSTFPAVSIVEADNRVFTRMRTATIENAASVMYEVNIYSNRQNGKKQEAKAIAETIDRLFEVKGFTRTTRNQVPNFNDATIYRLVCRYEGVIGLPGADGKYLIYQN